MTAQEVDSRAADWAESTGQGAEQQIQQEKRPGVALRKDVELNSGITIKNLD